MDPNEHPQQAAHAHVEADAVCAECGSVNPPETLLCKDCGNNLRDQRARRLAMLDVVDGESRSRPRLILAGLLGVFGVLLVFWVFTNMDTIEDWMASRMGEFETATSPEDYWQGVLGTSLDELAGEIEGDPATRNEVRNAIENPVDAGTVEGRYIITNGTGSRDRVLGEAEVRRLNGRLYFVAVLGRDLEARGMVNPRGATTFEAQVVGIFTPGGYIDGFGMGTLAPDGVVSCEGMAISDDNSVYNYAAYPVASRMADAPVAVYDEAFDESGSAVDDEGFEEVVPEDAAAETN